MKKIVLLLFVIGLSTAIHSQSNRDSLRDSLKKVLAGATDDYTRYRCMHQLFYSYVYTSPDSAVTYAQQNLLLAHRLQSDSLLCHALRQNSELSQITGNFLQALKYAFEALKAAEKTKNILLIADAYTGLTYFYLDQDDSARALFYGKKAQSIFDSHFTVSLASFRMSDTVLPYFVTLKNLSDAYEKNNRLDSALKYIEITEQLNTKHDGKMMWPAVPFVYGNIYLKKGDYPKAIRYYQWGFNLAVQENINKDIMETGYGLATTYKKKNMPDSSIFYANKVLKANINARYPLVQINALTLLANEYKAKHNIDSTAKYFELALTMNDSLFSRGKLIQMQNQTFNEQVRQQELQEEQQKRLYRYRIYALTAGLGIFIIISFLLYRNSQQKLKAKVKIEKAYEELKITQAQLIQSEKMASLGELTAGIAHEIQNPLNFVNNFSEVNSELLVEMRQEISKKNYDEVNDLAKDIEDNQRKINEHGKRAESIVKGMLLHSRTSSGSKELTDINKQADEFLRLAYHGLRAKDKTFNAEIKTDYDPSIGMINVVPQEIGRLLLNLFNNAFYAVNEKQSQQQDGYEPAVSVHTKRTNDKVIITVKDNGNGIPQKVIDKIFQPFFTTKPTGQGTGLGLSLAYDIIKAHGGEIKVENREGAGIEFVILLPIN